MNYSIPVSIVKAFLVIMAISGIIAIIARVHPLLTTIFTLFYCFVAPSLKLEEYLQNRMVGLQIRGKALFFFPIFLVFLLVLISPFWEYSIEYPDIVSQWLSYTLVIIILIETVFIIRFARPFHLQATPGQILNVFLVVAGVIVGILLAIWL